jgi:integral membrane protein (TIGR01906 family)
MLLLFANALIFDEQTHRALLAPEAVEPTLQLLDYFRGNAPVPALFSAQEQAHLADVKNVVTALRYGSLVLFVIFLALLWFAERRKAVAYGFCLLLFLTILLAVLPFDNVFDAVHRLLFAEGTWFFSRDSALIQLYPFSFFQDFFKEIVLTALAFSAAFAGIPLVQHHKV